MNNFLEELAVQNSNRANELGIENMKLKKRIDKAIELIEAIEYFEKETKGIMRFPTIKIKNILKGEENE